MKTAEDIESYLIRTDLGYAVVGENIWVVQDEGPDLVVSIAGSVVAAGPDDPAELDVDGKVRLGIRWLDLDGDKAKFNEYRNVGKDFGFAAEEVMLRGYKGQYFFFVEGLELDRDGDRSAEASVGRFGSFEVNLGWDETTHNFADDVPFIGTLQGGQ